MRRFHAHARDVFSLFKKSGRSDPQDPPPLDPPLCYPPPPALLKEIYSWAGIAHQREFSLTTCIVHMAWNKPAYCVQSSILTDISPLILLCVLH